MAERRAQGVLDTSVVVDLPVIAEAVLPIQVAITAVTLAELSQGPHLAATPRERSIRLERLQVVEAFFPSPLPFDAAAARRYGSLVALVLEAGRAVRPRRIDLMIAATAAVHALPLFTRNAADFEGLHGALEIVAV
ncbi:MAG: type II toxin-antitoxin system VapC family toxin [Trueperaceae bacterium]